MNQESAELIMKSSSDPGPNFLSSLPSQRSFVPAWSKFKRPTQCLKQDILVLLQRGGFILLISSGTQMCSGTSSHMDTNITLFSFPSGIFSYLWGNFGFVFIQCLYSQYPSIQFTAMSTWMEPLVVDVAVFLSLTGCFTVVKSFFGTGQVH